MSRSSANPQEIKGSRAVSGQSEIRLTWLLNDRAR
jgi:hypothetical protein